MQRPSGISISVALMVVFMVVGCVVTFTMTMPPMPPNFPLSPAMMATVVYSIAIVATVIAGLCVFFYWKGYEWARWVVMIDCVFELYGLISIAKTWHLSHLSAGLKICEALLAICLLWYLNTAPIRAWFKAPKSDPNAA